MMPSDSADKPNTARSDRPKDDRRQREAAALRENLRKRKMQQRARDQGTDPSPHDPRTGPKDPDAH